MNTETTTATDAFTPNLVWEKALARIEENERLREAAHKALRFLAIYASDDFFALVTQEALTFNVECVQRWMERCG